MATVLDPVPAWPATCQLSSIVQSDRGTSMNPGWGGGPGSGAGNWAPRMTHSELSTLETNCQRPSMRQPPSTFCVVPVGAYETQANASGLALHTSFWAASGKPAISHWWIAPMAQHQAEDVQPRPSSVMTSMNAVKPYS